MPHRYCICSYSFRRSFESGENWVKRRYCEAAGINLS